MKINRRFFLTAASATTVSAIFAGCQQSTPVSDNASPSAQDTPSAPSTPTASPTETIKVGVTGIVAEDILKYVNKELAPQGGLKVEIVMFSDWIQPNTALRDRVIDANFFQHRPFMNNAAKELKIDLVALNTVLLNTLGLFSKSLTSVDQIPQNATVTIANDVINNDRGLRLLAANGLLKLDDTGKEFVTQRTL